MSDRKSTFCSGECSGKYMELKLGSVAEICGHFVATVGLKWCGGCAVGWNVCQFCGKQRKPEEGRSRLFFCSNDRYRR